MALDFKTLEERPDYRFVSPGLFRRILNTIHSNVGSPEDLSFPSISNCPTEKGNILFCRNSRFVSTIFTPDSSYEICLQFFLGGRFPFSIFTFVTPKRACL